MNIELLQKVRDYIHTYPDELNMDKWCGTTRCIAGTAVVLSNIDHYNCPFGPEDQHPVEVKAQTLLELSGQQARRLFHRASWLSYGGRRFGSEYANDFNLPEYSAKIACDYIDAFIAHNGEAPTK